MYTQKDYQNDLFNLSKNSFVKYALLKDFTTQAITQQDFTKALAERKSQAEIEEILQKLNDMQNKLQSNGGTNSENPIAVTTRLRKNGELEQAFRYIVPFVQQPNCDIKLQLTFGWVMYDYLKISESNIDAYCKNLNILNQFVRFDFSSASEKQLALTNYIFRSLFRVISQGEQQANQIFAPFMQFIGNKATFLLPPTSYISYNSYATASESLPSEPRNFLKKLLEKLNLVNYFTLMDHIGFDWFCPCDYQKTTFPAKDGTIVELPPLAETILQLYAKKLLHADDASALSEFSPVAPQETFATQERLLSFEQVLLREISKNPNNKWLFYYHIQLLQRLGRKEEAFSLLVTFAKEQGTSFYVWNMFCELTEGEDRFHCLCAAMLSKTKPEMLVKLQLQFIALLVEKGMLQNAKAEIESQVQVRQKNNWKIPEQILHFQQADWYLHTTAAENRDALLPYAQLAEQLLYRTLPLTDVFVTFVNKEKNTIHVAYAKNQDSSFSQGYFYDNMVQFPTEVKENQVWKLRFTEDKNRERLLHVHDVQSGEEAFRAFFFQEKEGVVKKLPQNSFAFVDDTYIPASLVNKYHLQNQDTIRYTKRFSFSKKKQIWQWVVLEILAILAVDSSQQTENFAD